jgi:uncharacterized membrane protein YoaK (UPF0700 family)
MEAVMTVGFEDLHSSNETDEQCHMTGGRLDPSQRLATPCDMKTLSQKWAIATSHLSLVFLSLASGCTDVLSFLKLGNVFTSAMTGNTALLAIALGQGQLFAAMRSLMALIGFISGIAAATALSAVWRGHADGYGTSSHVLLLELAVLVACAVLWSASLEPIQGLVLSSVILLSSLGMGIQAVGARRINASGVSTVVFTSPLVTIVMSAVEALIRPGTAMASSVGSGAHVGTLVAYGAGAVLAALLMSQHVAALIWLPVIAVLVAFGFQLAQEQVRRT